LNDPIRKRCIVDVSAWYLMKGVTSCDKLRVAARRR